MTLQAPRSRLAAASLAAVAGLTAATALAADRTPATAVPTSVPVVVQDGDGTGRPALERIAAARALAARLAPGARVTVLRVYGPADAAGVVARVAASGPLVVGSGTDVRAALEVARHSWPGLRTATVPAATR